MKQCKANQFAYTGIYTMLVINCIIHTLDGVRDPVRPAVLWAENV